MRISDWSSDVCSSDLDLVPEEGDAPGGVLIVRGEKLDRVAAHAERPALEGGLVAFVLEGDQLPDDLARVVRLPLGAAERHCRIGFDRPYAVKTRPRPHAQHVFAPHPPQRAAVAHPVNRRLYRAI